MVENMQIEYDETKNQTNIEKHGFSLSAFSLLDLNTATFVADNRTDYGEKRIRIFALLQGWLCVGVFTKRGEIFRVISLRKANKREQKSYEKQKNR